MEHLGDDLLSLLALGERPASEREALHLSGCTECAATLSALQRTVYAATVNADQVRLEAPGSHVWAAIHGTLGLSPSLAEDPLRRPADSTAGPSTDSPALPAPADQPAAPISLQRHPSRRAGQRPGRNAPRRGPWLLGMAAGILLGAAGAWTAVTIFGSAEPPVAAPTTTPPGAVVLAQAALAPLAGHTASGSALVEKLPDGTRQVVISLPEEKLQGFREVWFGSADLSKMVSLGVLGQGTRAFVIPGGLNLSDYPVIDISDEPYDGDPAHSAESIARGKFAVQG